MSMPPPDLHFRNPVRPSGYGRRIILRRVLWSLSILSVAVLTVLGIRSYLEDRQALQEVRVEQPAVPHELEMARPGFNRALQALQEGDGGEAVEILGRLSFGERPVEQYRLYFLAQAFESDKNELESRRALARLWRLSPVFIHRKSSALKLAALYEAAGNWNHSAEILNRLAGTAVRPREIAVSRDREIVSRLASGDLTGLIASATDLTLRVPGESEAVAGEVLLRSLGGVSADAPLPFSWEDRFRQAKKALEADRAEFALTLLDRLQDEPAPSSARDDEAGYQRAIILKRLRRFEASTTILETLTGGPIGLQSIILAAENDRAIAAEIQPVSSRNVSRRVRSGTHSVRKNGKIVKIPVYRKVTQTIRSVDPRLRDRKAAIEKREAERLRGLLDRTAERALILPALTRLVQRAERAADLASLEADVPRLVALDPSLTPGLSLFWSRGWNAWVKHDLNTAAENFAFIASTYRHTGVVRQSRYWYARSIERLGDKVRAQEIYDELADTVYRDVYANFAIARGARRPLEATGRSVDEDPWPVIAERTIPSDLKLAYELTALGITREARLEVQANRNAANQKWTNAILAELSYGAGSFELAHRYLRGAFPELSTVDQDVVPEHFLRMYYLRRFDEIVTAKSIRHGVDPDLVMGLIHQESSFEIRAQSRVGAIGLMQLMPATGRELARRAFGILPGGPRLNEPEVNIDLGATYLAQLIRTFDGQTEVALAAYNAGPGRVGGWRRRNARQPLDEFVESIPISETRNYVKRIMLLWSGYAAR